ncbi:MAG: hypothetical protein PHI29_03670 [Gallionella sp.]|nr:hypothetical protein [Gallionella sp.]
MKKLALLACSMLFVSSVACAAEPTTAEVKAEAQKAVKANANVTGFTVGGVAYGVAVVAGVITITQGNGSGSTVTVGTVGTI